jgi:NADH kinase
MDGQEPSPTLASLSPGQSVTVEVSRYPIPCIERTPSKVAITSQKDARDIRSDDWVKDINTLLQFNASFRNKGLLRHTR